ncbi:MAG: GGDEF domain-containing protein [Arenimonas sp.]|uniref:GGDEF domain-containing protein n=1 Tax=Arenimonas sp. TaxID=1872635 RepID=UPI003C09D11E
MWKKLLADLQLSILMLVGGMSSAFIAAFSVYRFYNGNVKVGVLDATISLAMVITLQYAWRSPLHAERAGRAMVLVNVVGAIASSELLGVTGAFWMYLAIVANCFITSNLSYATAANTLMLLVIAFLGHSFNSTAQQLSFLATSGLLTLFSYIIAGRLSEQQAILKRQASIDPLTGAYNRRRMEEEMHLAIEEYTRSRMPMAIILMDLDDFKNVNDKHGHEAGDDVLASFAEMVRGHTRQVDRFFRYGGEEFLMLAKGLSPEEARHLAEKIRCQAESALTGRHGTVTVSAGVAGVMAGESCMQWVARADAALYAAKQSGRNRVHLAD